MLNQIIKFRGLFVRTTGTIVRITFTSQHTIFSVLPRNRPCNSEAKIPIFIVGSYCVFILKHHDPMKRTICESTQECVSNIPKFV